MHRRSSKYWILAGLTGIFLSGVGHAAQFGNTTASTGRPIMADGTTYTDQITPTSTVAWFVFRMIRTSHLDEVWSPVGKFGDIETSVAFIALFESDGTTFVAATNRDFDFPSPQVDVALTRGGRLAFVNNGGTRRVALHVQKNGPAPSAPFDFAVRVVPTTLAAARWSVNGYNDFLRSRTSPAPTVPEERSRARSFISTKQGRRSASIPLRWRPTPACRSSN